MRLPAIAVAMLALAPRAWIAAQEPSPESFVLRDLKLEIAIEFQQKQLTGTAIMELENWTAQPARRVSLLLNRLMEASRVSDGAGDALRFAQDVRRFEDVPLLQVTQLVIDLKEPVLPGQRVTTHVEFGGNLVGYSEVGWLYVKDRIDTAFTILRTDAFAFPSVGGLNRGANRRAPNVEFTYTVAVRVPPPFLVAAGGNLARTVHTDRTVTWRYTSSGPSPFLNVAIAPFDTLSENGLHIFHFHEDSIGARQLMKNAQAALRTLAAWFGAQRGPVNLTITEIPDGWGSQASLTGGIIQSAAAFKDDQRARELYHELAHLWHARDLDNPSPRWNEGLASFLEALLMERLNGWTGRQEYETRYLEYLKRRAAGDEVLRTVPFIEYGKRGMTDYSYSVGWMMFGALYELLGEAEFNKAIGGYYHGATDGGTTRDFIGYVKRISSRDVSAFFEDWMFTTRWTAVIANATSVQDVARHYRDMD